MSTNKIKRVQLNHQQVFKFRSYMETLSENEIMQLTPATASEHLGFPILESHISAVRREKGLFKKVFKKKDADTDVEALMEMLEEQGKRIQKLENDVEFLKRKFNEQA